MVDVSNPGFRSWDAFNRLFDEAFARTKPAPFSPSMSSATGMEIGELHQYANADAGVTPYASPSPTMETFDGELELSSSGEESLEGGVGRGWEAGALGDERRSTVTTTGTRTSNSNSSSWRGGSGSSSGPTVPLPVSPPPVQARKAATAPKLKRCKSRVSFKDSADGKNVTVTFDLPGISKADVHVSYQRDKVVVSWESVNIEERVEENRIIRETRERRNVRTLPLAEGTKFEQVKASMDGRRLVLMYPNPKFTPHRVHVIEIKAQ